MPRSRRKFATQVNTEILAAIHAIAEKEVCQVQALVDEAFADLIEKRKQAIPRRHVMAAYRAGRDKYDELYMKLAK